MNSKVSGVQAARRAGPPRSGEAVREELATMGIHAWGSQELLLHERNLTRYFTREYRHLVADGEQLDALRRSIETLPMAEKTERLMDEHYDGPLALFRSFLDRRHMAYTMAWYGEDADSVRRSTVSLEQAQSDEYALAAKRMGLRGDERILNIGCGFGSLESWLFAHHPDVEVVSVTPSKVQAAYIRQCMADPAHVLPADRITLVEKTLERLTPDDVDSKPFDLVVSVGMFEHVANPRSALGAIHDLLRPGGRCFLDFIVTKPVFLQHMDADKTLVGRYFPGARIWPYDALPQMAGELELEGRWYLNGVNYWRTLDEWHRRYWDDIGALYPAVLDAAGVRHWNDYFVLCKAVMFGPLDGETYGNGHYLFRRPD